LPQIEAIRSEVVPYQILYFSEIKPNVLAIRTARASAT